MFGRIYNLVFFFDQIVPDSKLNFAYIKLFYVSHDLATAALVQTSFDQKILIQIKLNLDRCKEMGNITFPTKPC